MPNVPGQVEADIDSDTPRLTNNTNKSSGSLQELERRHPFSRDWDDRLANGRPTDPIGEAELESPSFGRPLAAVILSAIRQLAAVYFLAFGLVAAWVPIILIRRLALSYTGPRGSDTSSRVASETLYKNDLRPEMFWFLTAMPLALTLASPALVWAAVLGWRRYGHVPAVWFPAFGLGLPLCLVAISIVVTRVLRIDDTLIGNFAPGVFVVLLIVPVFYLTSRPAERITGIPRLALRLVKAQGMMIVCVVAYGMIVPRLWFAPWMTDAGRIGIRLVLHPLLFETANFFTRSLARSEDFGGDPSRVLFLVLPGVFFNGIYGRFLVGASSSTAITVILAIALSATEIGLRISVSARDHLLHRLIHGKSSAKRVFSTVQARRLRADLVSIEEAIEVAAIVATAPLTVLFDVSVTGAGASTPARAATDAVIQIAIEAVTDLIVTVSEERGKGRGSVPVLLG